MAKTIAELIGGNNTSVGSAGGKGKSIADLLGQSTTPTTPTITSNTKEDEDKNKGGFLGGLAYTVGKLGTGAASILEGIWDYTAGGIADLFGADEWAEEQFANNIVGNWNQSLDEWYNPGKGWQIAGDVASGIGNTLVGIGAVAGASLISGGTLSAPVASLVAGSTMGLGAAGGATSEAYAKTGTLGGKEYLYGGLSGALEGGLEAVTGAAGKVSAKLFGKSTAETIAKKSLVKGMLSAAAGEAFEEGVSEFVSPYFQRWTQVDPNAEKATWKQIGYAAMVGGLSGAIMDGLGTGAMTIKSASRGNEIIQNEKQKQSVVEMAQNYANYEAENNTGVEAYQYVSKLLDEYKTLETKATQGTLNVKDRLRQKTLLAEMEKADVVLAFEKPVQESIAKIKKDADKFVEYLNSRNLKDSTGKSIHYANGAALLADERMVTQLGVMDALGQLMLAPDTVYNTVSQGKVGGMQQADFDNFKAKATAQQKKAVGEMFGVDVDTVSYDDFVKAMQSTDAGKLEDIKMGMDVRRKSKQAITRVNNTNEQVSTFKKADIKNEGTRVYKTKDGKLFAVTKVGTDYYLFDGTNISKKLNIAQTIGAIKQLNGVEATQTPATTQKTAQNQTVASGTQNVSTESKTAQESKATQSQEKTEAEKKAEEEKKAKAKARREANAKKKAEQERREKQNALAKDFVAHMRKTSKERGGWYSQDVLKYVKEHPELNFIERIYAEGKQAKADLADFLKSLDDLDTLDGFKWYMGGAYTGIAYGKYRGTVQTFQNAVKKRMQEVGGGTNLGIENHIATLAEVEELFYKLNKNPEVEALAKKVFFTAKRLGVNIRFTNATFAKDQVAGDNVGDMVEYKTSYFNDTTKSDQQKASTIVHELIHVCTMYAMSDSSPIKSGNIATAAAKLKEIYEQIQDDADVKDVYGGTSADEMVAELSNEKFAAVLKKKNLWQRILDAICEFFGFNRGTTAYDSAMQCLDYMLDNPDVRAYKQYAERQRNLLSLTNMTFGQTTGLDINEAVSETKLRDNLAKGYDIRKNLAYEKDHKKDLLKNYDAANATESYAEIIGKYDKILKIWERLGGELDSKFLNEWNSKEGKDRTFTVFKEQAGYKYNIELSSMCKKGVPLFEAIDTIVKKEVMQELNLKTLGKAEKEILYDILKAHNFEIPCAICYVEQARQREGVIIDSFLDGKIETASTGKVKTYKLGWNQVLKNVQEEMRNNGVEYAFPAVDRNIATDKYSAKDYAMDEKTQEAFYAALQKLANEEITRYNKAEGKNKPLIKEITPEAIKKSLGGNVGANFKIFRVLFQNPNSRFTIEGDLLYSSMTTQNLSMWHNALYSLFNQQGGVSTYKTKQTPIVYWGDILNKKWAGETLRKEGGIRNQSNSDFQMYTLLDHAQMYMDFTAKGYYLQAYTKVLSELKLFGLSNGKINASLIPRVIEYKFPDGSVDIERTIDTAGLDENGNPIYDDIEGINHQEAFMLIEDENYSKSVTGICIGYSDKHIQKLLDDARVQLIIGFHDKTNDRAKRYRGAKYAKNYNGLNEATKNKVDANGEIKQETVHIGFNQFVQKAEKMFKFDAESGKAEKTQVYHDGKLYKVDDIPNLAADLYLQMCQEKNYTPAYDAFKGHPNYYKLLADFGLKDAAGHYAPHKKVAYNMPDKVPYLDASGKKQYMSTEAYIKAELGKELAVRDSISEALSDTSENGIIPQFKKEINRMREGKAEISKFALTFGAKDVSSRGKYQKDTDAEVVLTNIEKQNDITNFLPNGLSKDFINAIKSHGNFQYPRLYRGMEAAELDSIIENGYIKSNSSYNFTNQQGQTLFDKNIRTAYAYATSFAPSGIREKFYEQGMPAYIVEIGNYGDLNFKYNEVKESYTNKEIDNKYITRILELSYNQDENKVYARDISIEGMNQAKDEAAFGKANFWKDKTTGTLLYEVADNEGYANGLYISEVAPDLYIDYEKLDGAPAYEFDFRTSRARISGNPNDLVKIDFPKSQTTSDSDIRYQKSGNGLDKKRSIDKKIDKLLDDMSFEELMELFGEDNATFEDTTVEDVSEELNVPPKQIEIRIRREGLGDSYIADNHSAVMKQARIDEEIEDSGAQFNPSYARKYITRISPKDFIDLTVNENHVNRDAFDREVIGDHGGLMSDYDYQSALKNSRQSPYLHIDRTTGKVIGHNGRHRMRALEKSGIDSVEITVQFFDDEGYLMKYNAETIKDMAISSQFDTAIETRLSNVIPMNESHRAEIEQAYGEKAKPKAEILFDKGEKRSNGLEKPIKGADKVMTELPSDQITMKDVVTKNATLGELTSQIKSNARDNKTALQVLTTNAQAAVEKEMQTAGIKDATAKTNYVRAGKAAAQNAIDMEGAQYNLNGNQRVGESLGKIWQPIYDADKKDGKTYRDFQLYLLHHHNVDRYAVGKPVFNEWGDPIEQHVTDEDSRKAIAELDKEYSWFRKQAEKIWKYNDNNLQLEVDSGKISQESADYMREMYPHYVPTMREKHRTTVSAILGKNNIKVNNSIKVAKGSSDNILPIDEQMAAQTVQKIFSGRLNSLLVEMAEHGGTDNFQILQSENADIDADTQTEVTLYEDKKKNLHQITFYKDGKAVTAQVSNLFFTGIDAFQKGANVSNNLALNAMAKANSIFKKLVTSWNPFFSYIKNPIRDFQDALLYTKYKHVTFIKNYKRARKEIANNGKYWREAKAAGLSSATVYSYADGIDYKQKGVAAKRKIMAKKMEKASNAIEMSPRLAEYICAREAGLSVEKALLQAQDITTNFGRGGTFAKTMNATVMPFLNPAIQGFSKMWRAYVGKDAARSWINLIIRSLILGIGVTAFNDLINGDDDEEYENLSDYVKEQNYVIGLGDGDFLKLPKGRVLSIFGSAYLRGKRYVEGDDTAWEGYGKSVLSSVTPVDNITRTIFAPITDVKNNSTWYGGTIEGQKWDDTRPENRYDESTSKISIWLGQVFNYSPLKINYLLEQYTGIVGDLVLPATAAESKGGGVGGALEGVVTQNMLTNATTNSKWSSKWYDTIEEYTYKKTDGDLQAKATVQYLTRINKTISEMYAQKRKILGDSSIPYEERTLQTRILQATINTQIQETLGNLDFIYNEFGKYDLSNDEEYKQAYLDIITLVEGEKNALEYYNKETYTKATNLTKLGIDYASFYNYYFGGLKDIESDKNADGTTISGSKKEKVLKYTMAQDLPTTQKIILLMSQGYTISDGDIRGLSAYTAKQKVAKYISSLSISKDEKAELAKMLGYTVKNGRILLK